MASTISRSRSRRSSKRRSRTSPMQQRFLQGIDWGILAAIFVIPLFIGGRLALGQVALVTITSWMTLSWLLYQACDESPKYRLTRFEPILFLAGLLLWVQCASLPAEWIAKISPKLIEMLPLWSSADSTGYSLGEWSSISITPAATKQCMLFLIGYSLIFLVTAQRIKHVDDIERILKWVGLSALAMAVFGLAQYFLGNGKFFWSFEHPTVTADGAAKGSFTNGNHFGHFLVLGAGPLLWWFMKESSGNEDKQGRRRSKDRQFQNEDARPQLAALILCGLGVVAFALLMALTRGGVVALLISLTISLLICVKRGYVSGKVLWGLAGGTSLAIGGLFLYGMDAVSANLDDWNVDRWLIWKTNWAIFQDYPILGTGLGSHFESYRNYLNTPMMESKFTHAESGYLQILSETGSVGITLLGIAVLYPLYWCGRGLWLAENRQEVIILATVLGSFVANYVHSIVDFVWWVPACFTLLLIQAACACRMCQITSRRHQKTTEHSGEFPRFLTWGGMLAMLMTSTWLVSESWSVYQGEHSYFAFQRMAQKKVVATDSMQNDHLVSFEAKPTKELSPEEIQQQREYNKQQLVTRINFLIDAVRHNPLDAELQLKVAEGYLTYFELLQINSENPMSTSDIRDTVFDAQFETLETQNEWLSRAIGDNMKFLNAAHKHTKQALSLCPLLGDAYVQLNKTAFLDGANADSMKLCLDQAMLVRPYDGDVLFAQGRHRWSERKYEEALNYWKTAFHQEVRLQKEVIRLIVGRLEPKFVLEFFEPDWYALRRLKQQYQTIDNPQELEFILNHYAKAAIVQATETKNKESIRAWQQAISTFLTLKQPENAEQCLVAALKRHPNHYQLHDSYGKLLFKQGRMKESLEHIRWCLNYQPNDKKLRSRYEIAQKRGAKESTTLQMATESVPARQ